MNFHLAGKALVSGLTVFCLAAYSFSGRVIDERNQPVADVAITALKVNQQAITSMDGTFSLAPVAVRQPGSVVADAPIKMNGRHLTLAISAASQLVTISQFDVAGRLISTIIEKRLGQGIHTFASAEFQAYSGLSVVRISIGSETYTLGALGLGSSVFTSAFSGKNLSVNNVAGKSAAMNSPGSDTLLLTKKGYLDKRVMVKDSSGILGNIRLYDTAFDLNVSNFPKLDGSTTNKPLAKIIACKFLNVSYTWKKAASISGVYWDVFPDSADKPTYDKIMAMTNFSKTPQSYDSLIAGKRELILVASGPSTVHIETAHYYGVDFDIRPFATDALLMVVNKKNSISGMTTQNIRDIYTRQVTNWNQIGGPDCLIRPYQREATSGSQELLKMLVMKETPINSLIPLSAGMLSVFESLARDTTALCYTPYYYYEYQMRDSLIRSVKVDAVQPDRNTLYSRAYPHCAPVLVVSLTKLSDTSRAAKLRDWLLAPQGLAVVNESGYVPIRKP